jgi:hypothetical protein
MHNHHCIQKKPLRFAEPVPIKNKEQIDAMQGKTALTHTTREEIL